MGKKFFLIAALALGTVTGIGIILYWQKVSWCFLSELPELAYQQYYLMNALPAGGFTTMPNKILGKHVTLKKLCISDRKNLSKLFLDSASTTSFFVHNGAYLNNHKDAFWFIDYLLVKQAIGSAFVYVVLVIPEDQTTPIIGGIIGTHISQRFKQECEILGISYAQHWGKPGTTESTYLFLNAFFKHTGLQRILACTSPHNGRCHSFLLKAGFNFSHISHEESAKNCLLFKREKHI